MSLFMVDGIGEVIARHRVAAGLTVAQVAEQVGVSARRYAMYEANRADVPDTRLLKIALAVGVNPAELSLECLFFTRPELEKKPIGRELRDLTEWIKSLPPDPPKAAGKKPPTRTPPRRRVAR